MIVSCNKCGAKNRLDEKAASMSRPVCGKCGASLDVTAGAEQAGTADAGKPVTVTDQSFRQQVLNVTGRPVLVDAWAAWCGPCRMIAPVLDQLASEASGRYVIAKLNVDENPRTASEFGIQSIPTLLIFKNGKLVDRMVGVQSKQAIALRLQSAASAAA